MIEKMHEKSNGIVFKVIFALISISFVLGGIGAGLTGVDSSAVKVNGEEISQQAFNSSKGRQQSLMNEQMGERFWDLLDNPVYVAQFHQSILDGLIDDELLRQYAQQLKLGISAEQIKAQIVNTPAFHQDGKFDNSLYQNALRNAGLTADGYAAVVYEGLLFSQIQEGIVNSNFSVPVQQELLAKLLLQKRTVRLATFPVLNELEKQTATVEELQKFYDEHKDSFINPEQMAVEYVTITPAELAKNVQVTDDQIKTFYETNKSKYVTVGEARIAHIQAANENDAKVIEQALRNGEDFAKVAKEKSADKLSAAQGGDLGWAKPGIFPKTFEDTANSLQVGQFSQPVKVDGNFHIIKVLERNVESAIPLEQVKNQITETIRNELVLNEYSNVTREMANQAFESSGSLENVAKVANAQTHKTTVFTRNSVPAELNNEKVVRALFDTEIGANGQNSEAIEIGDSANPKTIFVRAFDYKAQSVQSFDEAKNAIEQAVKLQKAQAALLAKAKTQVEALQKGEAVNLPFGQAQDVVFAQAQTQSPAMLQTIFAMAKPTDKATYQASQNENGDVVIIALDKVADGTAEEFKPFATQISQADQVILRNDLIKDLRNRAKIEYNQDFIEQINNTKQ
ncbi:peptidylprolyl isomerase [Pasteurellaceae bacterium 15-036681]|nr:peptidylprolyl isomerase [Pasteurellaceae bacterium 15-036681]